jgi:NADPH:quinone reductase-like Zn-dependent oxidoreductase
VEIMSTKTVRIHGFGGIEMLRYEDIEVSQPDATEILIAARAASVNPVDFKIRSGKYPAVKEDKLPYILGRDASGIVEKCGPGAKKFRVGDEVFGIVGINGGGYAQKVILEQDAVAAKPARLDHVHAAAVPLAGQTAWQGLFRYGEVKSGQRILIHGGSGGVGHFAVQFAKAKGAHVTTTVSTDNVEFAKGLGADVVIDYKKQPFEQAVRDLDMVFDLIDGETRERSWALLMKGGILVTTLTEPSQQKAREHGIRATRYTVQANGDELKEIAQLIDAGKVKPAVAETFPLNRAADALGAVEKGHSRGKTVITIEP